MGPNKNKKTFQNTKNNLLLQIEMPVAFSDSPQDLTSLMQDIIEVLFVIQIMIKNRIHKNDDINNLFQRVALKNTNLTQAQMESVFKLIRDEFEQ